MGRNEAKFWLDMKVTVYLKRGPILEMLCGSRGADGAHQQGYESRCGQGEGRITKRYPSFLRQSFHIMSSPPFISMVAPVMKDDSSEARNATRLASSSGLPILLSGIFCASSAIRSLVACS
jgi:hypothetical protein